MLLVPVILIMLTGIMFRDQYEKGFDGIEFSKDFLSELYSIILEEPDSLLTIPTLNNLSRLSTWQDVNISVYRENHEAAEFSTISKHSPSRHISSSWNFYFSDGTKGRFQIFVRDRKLLKGAFPQNGLSVILVITILILTNGVLSFLVAGSIIKPLNTLKDAAIRIKEEDLDSSIVYGGNDEFKDVCTAFEQMRVRLKESLNKQLKAEENRKELLSSISHDLKTPITTIKGYIEGIKDGIADSPEKVEKYIDTVYKKSILMNNLIDRLFLFSKLDLNRVQFNFRSINLNVFLRDICNDLQYDYPECKIVMESNSDSVEVIADSIHLHRVMTNLVDNAVKYRGDMQPEVQIGFKETRVFTEVTVKDNGRGILTDDLYRIFERFYRTDPARGSDVEGSGLGLAISKQIIIAHGGNIEAESSPGTGTLIKFTLRKAE
jgi:signal transduction histidine kinase